MQGVRRQGLRVPLRGDVLRGVQGILRYILLFRLIDKSPIPSESDNVEIVGKSLTRQFPETILLAENAER